MAPRKKNSADKPKKAASPKTKKPKVAKAAAPAAAADKPKPKGGASQIGHNSRIPSEKEMEGYFTRLDSVHTKKRESNARYMTDIKNIYEEAANKFGSSRKIMRMLYAKKEHELGIAEQIAEMEAKERDDFDRLILGASKAFGEETAFGAWLRAQATVRDIKAADHDEVKPPESKVVKTPAQAVLENIQSEERDIAREQTTH